MTKEELKEYREALKELNSAKRKRDRLIGRRDEIEARQVRNPERKARFLMRLNQEIVEQQDRIARAELAVEGFENG